MALILEVKKRTEKGKQLARLRAGGVLPAVMYGPKEEATPISLDQATFERIYKEAGESTIISLAGLGEEKETLVHDVYHDPVTGKVLHVDFYALERGKKLQVEVGLEYEGEAPVLKKGATLTKVLREVEVECRPKDLPKHIIVDVSVLAEIDDRILVKDLALPEGVEILKDPEDVVAIASEVIEEVEEVPEEVDMDAIEVEQKGKEEGVEEKEEEEKEKTKE